MWLSLFTKRFILSGLCVFTSISQSISECSDSTLTLPGISTDTQLIMDAGTYRLTATGIIQTCNCGDNQNNPCFRKVDADGATQCPAGTYQSYGQPFMSLFVAIGSPCTDSSVTCGTFVGKSGKIVLTSTQTVYFKVADEGHVDVQGSLSINIVCSSNAGGGGDPHFLGFGGIDFTWQGHCDTVLMKTPNYSNTETAVEVHIRTRMVRKWSAIDAIAIKIGQDVVEIESNQGKLVLNRNEVESIQTDSFSVVKSISISHDRIVLYKFVIDKDKKLDVKVNTRSKMVYTMFNGDYPPGTVGLLGSPHSPGFFTRDGKNMEGKDINSFAESWQVNESDPRLFHVSRQPQFPSKCLYRMSDTKLNARSRHLREMHEVTVKEATNACATHSRGPLREFCIEDAMLSGDLDSAKDTFYD